MKDDIARPVPRPAPGYGFGKRLKTAGMSALITSLCWVVFMVLYWPRGERPDFSPIDSNKVQPAQAGNQASSSLQPSKRAIFDGQASYTPPTDGLKLPVQGVMPSELTDTYSQARGNGTREHNAIDIVAPHGTPVLAAAAGTLAKLFVSNDGGNTVYERSPDGKAMYYYAHLDTYAPELTEGMAITRGQVLGFVGSTGDADPAAPHLHFAISALAPGENWWEGRPVNPYPLLGGR